MRRRASVKFRLFALLTVQAAWLVGLLVLALRNAQEDFPYIVGVSVCLLASAALAFLIGRSWGDQEQDR